MGFEIISKTNIDSFKSVKDAIWTAHLRYLGELESGKSGLNVLHERWNEKIQKGIMQLNHKYIQKSIMSLALIDHIGPKRVIIKSTGVSGTIKNAVSKL